MTSDDLFSQAIDPSNMPLAARMRPSVLDEVIGQDHLLGEGSPLRRLIESPTSAAVSVLLWGPPGTGKTTLASLLAGHERRFVEVSAVSAGIKDLRAAIDQARVALGTDGRQTVLFVDEVHRFSRTQQDALLPAVENGWVILVAATTENPAHSVVSPLLSRSLVLTLEPLTDDAIRTVVERALVAPRGLGARRTIDESAMDVLVRMASGDARRALTILEAAAGAADDLGADQIGPDALERAADRALVRYDRAGDQHYDVISAFIKSIRGSDVDAALHYLARMVEAGEDPRFIARRLVILASEDIGLADPTALTTAVAAAQAVQFIGLPEGRLSLAQATIALALAPKSNAVIRAIDAATSDVRAGHAGVVPLHLRDAHTTGSRRLGHGEGYRYPHDEADGVSAQEYAPQTLRDREYYVPSRFGAEARMAEILERLEALRRPGGRADGPGPAGD
jgi:putative ATPase